MATIVSYALRILIALLPITCYAESSGALPFVFESFYQQHMLPLFQPPWFVEVSQLTTHWSTPMLTEDDQPAMLAVTVTAYFNLQYKGIVIVRDRIDARQRQKVGSDCPYHLLPEQTQRVLLERTYLSLMKKMQQRCTIHRKRWLKTHG